MKNFRDVLRCDAKLSCQCYSIVMVTAYYAIMFYLRFEGWTSNMSQVRSPYNFFHYKIYNFF